MFLGFDFTLESKQKEFFLKDDTKKNMMTQNGAIRPPSLTHKNRRWRRNVTGLVMCSSRTVELISLNNPYLTQSNACAPKCVYSCYGHLKAVCRF